MWLPDPALRNPGMKPLFENITLKELCLLSCQELGSYGESVSGIPPLKYAFLKIGKPCCHNSNRKHV